MIGAILGDMIGAPYEFDMGDKTKNFPLFSQRSRFTDDTVMTIAVAEALMNTIGWSDDAIRYALFNSMQYWGHEYPYAGYGTMFWNWLNTKNPTPYNSYGNGSAMRVSSAGWLYDTMEETRHVARLTAEVTHNHPEGIKGAEATASAIFLARTGHSKAEIREYVTSEFGYNLTRTCDEIRPTYHHVESCQETVPEAMTAFLEGTDFEDVIRTAVSLGGDCDTLTCIAGSIAEAFYGVPEEIAAEGENRLTEKIKTVLDRFKTICRKKAETDSRLWRRTSSRVQSGNVAAKKTDSTLLSDYH
ncbi:MAG: ADP-ribosylglycohydrolase family protein [Clostridia bacterium]|nr:ADP-ribosylglycohydrolase family protein [Clostridia bacterium]